MTSTERPFSLRSVALAAFLPTFLFSVGEGAIIPLIPIVANNLGASLAMAGFIAAMIMVGELIGDIPIFVSSDSSDVWGNPENFLLDERRRPTAVAGVPPVKRMTAVAMKGPTNQPPRKIPPRVDSARAR